MARRRDKGEERAVAERRIRGLLLRARAEHLAALTRPGSEPHGVATAALAQVPPEEPG